MTKFKKGDKVIYQGVYGDLWSWRRLNGLPVLTTSEWRTIAGATGTVQSATNTRVEVRFDNSHTWWHMPEDTLQIVDATKDDDLVVEDSGARPVVPGFSLGDRVKLGCDLETWNEWRVSHHYLTLPVGVYDSVRDNGAVVEDVVEAWDMIIIRPISKDVEISRYRWNIKSSFLIKVGAEPVVPKKKEVPDSAHIPNTLSPYLIGSIPNTLATYRDVVNTYEEEVARPYTPVIVHKETAAELVGYFYMQLKNQDGDWMAATKISSEKFQARVESVNQNFWKLAPEMKKRDPKNPERVYWTPPSTDQVRYYWGK